MKPMASAENMRGKVTIVLSPLLIGREIGSFYAKTIILFWTE